MTQNAHALSRYLSINFTTIFDNFRATFRMGGYEHGRRANKSHTVERETNQLNQPSRSCCAEDSLQVRNSGSDSGGNVHVKKIIIITIVGITTHLSSAKNL